MFNSEPTKPKDSTVAPVVDISKLDDKAIELALKHNNLEVAKLILRVHSIIPSYKKNSFEPYNVIAYKCVDLSHINSPVIDISLDKGQTESLQLLICEGKYFSHVDRVLQRGAKRNSLRIVKSVLEKRGDNDIESFINDALRRASENGHIEVFSPLLGRGANAHADNEYALRCVAQNDYGADASAQKLAILGSDKMVEKNMRLNVSQTIQAV
ncbi:hypothetical protein BB560_000070 [Smittium megazygosporum]|uniref:Uncharacterized protein n=1 Tax=Smittium megazygosporum TaxID=133381 RepID=A0A2T9ZLH4_9FUNG|nr:hypothetical protein BB560_000070 [Smittium megazygosporum]